MTPFLRNPLASSGEPWGLTTVSVMGETDK